MYFEGKWYKKIILSYVIIFLIPMLVNIGLLEKNKVSDREEYGKEICANLEITVQWMDNNLREIDNIIEILQKDTNLKWIANYMKPEKKYSEFTRITEAEKLCERVSYTTVTDEFYVYLDKPKIILSSNRVFMDSEQDNNYFFRYEEDEKFMEMLQSPKYVNTILPSRVTIQNGKTVDQMVYVRSMLDHNAKKIGTFVFPVQSRKFKEILEKAVLPEQGWIYLENADGETVLETESESEIGTLKKLSPEIFRERKLYIVSIVTIKL